MWGVRAKGNLAAVTRVAVAVCVPLLAFSLEEKEKPTSDFGHLLLFQMSF